MDVVLIVYRELSAQVDADVERRKELEAIRVGGAHPPLQTPTYHNVYTTLKNNRRITRLQVCVCVCCVLCGIVCCVLCGIVCLCLCVRVTSNICLHIFFSQQTSTTWCRR